MTHAFKYIYIFFFFRKMQFFLTCMQDFDFWVKDIGMIKKNAGNRSKIYTLGYEDMTFLTLKTSF